MTATQSADKFLYNRNKKSVLSTLSAPLPLILEGEGFPLFLFVVKYLHE